MIFPRLLAGSNYGPVWLNPVCFLLLLLITPVSAQALSGISEAEVDAVARRTMTEFNVPGMAIGIVNGDKVLIEKGYGIRETGNDKAINPATLFRIASNSKAFTTAALAVLVDDGLISWDGLVIDYLPEFRLKDPWVTANFTVRDLLTHRSGLAPHAGDMLLWPEPNAFTVADIIHALRYFEPVSSFRSSYAYDNLFYIIGGEIVARVSGQSWGGFVEKRLMRPAGMKRCFADKIPKKQMKNLAVPHAVVEAQLSVVERNRIQTQTPVSAAAGGVVCSLQDMIRWVQTQLNNGTTPEGAELFSAARSREMWKPQILLNVSERDFELSRTHFKAYGLGWRLADVHGFKQVSHTGSLSGTRSQIVLIPELELGVVILTNGSSSAARSAVMNTIVRSFMPVEQLDWVQMVLDERAAATAVEPAPTSDEPAKSEESAPCSSPDLSLFTGRYRDPWFGDVSIEMVDGQLVFAAGKSPRLTGPMRHLDGNRFIVNWTDRALEADARVLFETGRDGKVTGISMTKLDDGDYDFEDLKLSRVE